MRIKMPVFLSVLIFLLIFSSAPTTSADAGNVQFDESLLAQEDERLKDISESQMLSHPEVLQIAKKHIQGYLADDIQTKDRIITASTNLIPLYDLRDQIIAYAVPLLEREREIGYISVGALRDGYDAYDIFIDDSVVQRLHHSLSNPSIMATL